MKRLSRREQIMVAAAAVVTAAVLVPGFLPSGQAGAGKSASEAQRRHDQVMAELMRTRAEMNGMQEEINRHVSTGTPRDLVEAMLQEAQAAAKIAGVRLEDLKPAQPESVAGLRRVPVQITLSAAFPRTVRFLYELQRQDQRLRVDAVRMSSGAAHGDRLDLELRIVGYVKSEEEETHAPAS